MTGTSHGNVFDYFNTFSAVLDWWFPSKPECHFFRQFLIGNKKCGRFSFVDGRSISRSVMAYLIILYNLGSQSILILFISMQICGVTGRAPFS